MSLTLCVTETDCANRVQSAYLECTMLRCSQSKRHNRAEGSCRKLSSLAPISFCRHHCVTYPPNPLSVKGAYCRERLTFRYYFLGDIGIIGLIGNIGRLEKLGIFPNSLKLSKFLRITKIKKKVRSEIRAVEYREVSSLKIIFYILLDKITNTEWGIGIMNFILQAICDRSR